MTQEQEFSWFTRLWRGDIGLSKVFWIYGVAVIIFLWLVFAGVLYRLAIGGVDKTLFPGLLLLSLLIGYQILVSVGVWRSAGNYSGKRVWAFLARSTTVLAGILLLANIWVMAQVFRLDAHDPSRNSANVAAHIDRKPELPFSGFWKGECGEDFGLAIEPSPNGSNYSVSFCGPGGCFKPGTYRPDTSLINDPKYKIVDNNTIEVSSRDGFSRYVRCQ